MSQCDWHSHTKCLVFLDNTFQVACRPYFCAPDCDSGLSHITLQLSVAFKAFTRFCHCSTTEKWWDMNYSRDLQSTGTPLWFTCFSSCSIIHKCWSGFHSHKIDTHIVLLPLHCCQYKQFISNFIFPLHMKGSLEHNRRVHTSKPLIETADTISSKSLSAESLFLSFSSFWSSSPL